MTSTKDTLVFIWNVFFFLSFFKSSKLALPGFIFSCAINFCFCFCFWGFTYDDDFSFIIQRADYVTFRSKWEKISSKKMSCKWSQLDKDYFKIKWDLMLCVMLCSVCSVSYHCLLSSFLLIHSQKLSKNNQKSSNELYREAAQMLAMACEFTENCRCLDCQVRDTRFIKNSRSKYQSENLFFLLLLFYLQHHPEPIFWLWWWRRFRHVLESISRHWKRGIFQQRWNTLLL